MHMLAALVLALPLARPSLAQDRPTLDLSLDEAVKRALENNGDIAVAKFDPEFSAEGVRSALSIYDPFLSGTLKDGKQTSPASSAFSGGTKVDAKSLLYNVGVNQYLPSGASVGLTFNNTRQDTNSVFATVNPSYASTLTLSASQPLLKNFRLDASRLNLRVSRKNKQISDIQFRETVVNTVASVKNLYYDLIYAMDNLAAQRESLSLAQKLLDENQIKVKVGTMAPLDVVQAESEVASREANVIAAESALGDAEDALKRAIFRNTDAATWQVRILPTDRPTAEPVTVDLGAAISTALAKRTDVVAVKRNLEKAALGLDYARDQMRPQLDLVASYGTTGLGGDQLTRNGLGGPVVTIVPGGYSDALSQLFGRDYPTWTVGVNVSYSLKNRAAASAMAQARIGKDQLLVDLQRLELQVATEVRSAARALETNYKLVESTRAARVLSEQRLDAEEKKFAAGMSTNFLVTQAQRDLAVAEVSELQSIAGYRKSVINFERVQEAGPGSPAISIEAVSSFTVPAFTSATAVSTSPTAVP
jgi:outer membrane protein